MKSLLILSMIVWLIATFISAMFIFPIIFLGISETWFEIPEKLIQKL